MTGAAPIYDILRDAAVRKAAGATNVEERAVKGSTGRRPGGSGHEVGADLLVVVGNVGLNTIAGRLLRIGARQRRAQVEDRRPDRPHHQLGHRAARHPRGVPA